MHNVAYRTLRAVPLGSGDGFNGDRESLQMKEAQACREKQGDVD